MRERNLSRNNINYNEETGYIPVSFLKMKNWIIIVNIMIRVMTEKGLSGNAVGKANVFGLNLRLYKAFR